MSVFAGCELCFVLCILRVLSDMKSFEFRIYSIEHMKYFMNSRDLFLALKKCSFMEYKSADNVILREETSSFSFR